MVAMNIITFKIGDENRIVLEGLTGEQKDKSIFADQYRKALHVMDVDLAHKAEYDKDRNEYRTNIFAFIGERGSGKTSCMSSIVDYLKSNKVEEAYPNLRAKHFVAMKLIDPTFFNNDNESIVGSVVSQLLQLFKDIREKKKKSGDSNSLQEQEIVEMFQVVGQNIDCLNKGTKMSPEDLEYLNQLSSAVDLKSNIRDLTGKLLRYQGEKDAVIIVPIDDIDMNRKGVTRMVEDIRRYLSNEYMLIMAAVHLEQLTMIEKQEYLTQYEKLLSNEQIDGVRIDEMTERFLDKFLPHAHRILMPEGGYYLDAPMVIKDNGKEVFSSVSVRQGVCEMIFAKTRYLFYNANDSANRIVPRNLRDLRHLIGLLYDMADYKNGKADDCDATGIYNKRLFKEYLFGTWCRAHIEEKMRQEVVSLMDIADVTLFNSRVIEILRSNFNDLEPLVSGNDEITKEILKGIIVSGNNNFNFSAGDSLNLIFLLEGTTYDEQQRNLLFLLKSLYSIRLYEYYDERTEEAGIESGKSELLLDDRVAKYGLSYYEKLVAGGLINPVFYHVVPKEKNGVPRQTRGINLAKLNETIADCVEHWDEKPAETIRLAEYFMLTTSRLLDTKNKAGKDDFVEPDYRKRQEPYYAQTFSAANINACFDANAFLFNMVRVKECYGRFPKGKEFYEKADAERDLDHLKSLWSKLKFETMKRDGVAVELDKFAYKRWLSWVTIRNAEILQQLLNVLSFARSENKSTSINKDVLASYYKEIARYAISNYDKKNDGSFFTIDYRFTSFMAESLTHCDEKLFDSIYNVEYAAMIPYEELFNPHKRDTYSKGYVRKKICKFLRDAKISLSEEDVVRRLEAIPEETITTGRVAEVVNALNDKIANNGSAEENA